MSILNPLADLVAWVIIHLHSGLGALFGPDTGLAWGLSIAVLVVLIRILLIPLFVKQVHAQRKMAQHAPQIAELRKKYKNDKQRLNEETMKFYKENGVNPLAGCLPLIPQMIVFFSLFYVLRAIADWTPKVKPAYGMTVQLMESAQKAKIFGVHLGDKLLFAHPAPPLHVALVIAATVVVSATTTFMTVRQSSKRGLMQTNMDPDNPMAQSQKYMMYIVPFFSLTGLYWQYGLVLYWVTTNLWTLGQQYFMFRNWEPIKATAVATGGVVRATQSALRDSRPSSGTAKPASGTAKPSSGTAKPASGTSAKAPSGGARTGESNGRADTAPSRGSAAPAARPRPAPRGQTASTSVGTTAQNGAEKRGLLRLGRQKPEPEPEPEPEVPTAKVVRQQPTRQARSKRSGKR